MRASADTIAAIATAGGRGGVGIVRVSGPRARQVGEGVVGSLPAPRVAAARAFRDHDGSTLDLGLALWFPGPHSFTGDDVVELHGHGGPVVLRLLLERCLALGARLAEPGEFSRRAFINERIDLAQAEAIVDLIDAASSEAARSAVRSLRGEFSAAIDEVASGLLDLRVLVEATLDFPEEDGVDFLAESDARSRLARVRAALAAVFRAARQGSVLRDGLTVVLAGAPNVGKSSLMNRLAGDEVAIVTEHPGTTRDAIRQTIVIGGMPVHLVDTAGLRESSDPVERIGIERTRAALAQADLILQVRSVAADPLHAEDAETTDALAALPASIPRLELINKIDLIGEPAAETGSEAQPPWTIRVSAKSGAGLDLLRAALRRVGHQGESAEGVFLARTRHLDALARAGAHLDRAAGERLPADLLAEELRLAHDALGEIVGRVSSDDLLGEIFGRFCIGK
jgi:tRNA modification GTPase